MTAQFPTTIPVYSNPTASMTLGSASHDTLHSNVNDDVIAIATKLGSGADIAAANEILVGSGAGASLWRKLLNADVDGSAGIVYSKLALTNGIQTADLVANATARVVQGVAFSGSSASATDVLLQALAITTTVTSDIFVCAPFFGWNSVTNPFYLSAQLNATTAVQFAAVSPPIASGYLSMSGAVLFPATAAGSHTINILWRRDTSGTMTAAGGRPFLVEIKR